MFLFKLTASIDVSTQLFLLWTSAQRSLSEVHVIFCECFFFHIFYGRLMLRPRLTEVRETFTRGGPWVWIEKCYYLDFFLVLLKLQGGPKNDEIWHIFRPRPQTFCSYSRTRQNIVILKKLVKHRWLLYMCATFGELWPTNPWNPRVIELLKTNDIGE